MPVPFHEARATRFDGPPRVIAAGFQLANGKLIGANDLFDDLAFDLARQQASVLADFLRRMGPFEPHRLPLDEMEYTTMPEVEKKLAPRFQAI
jgi:fructose 1,6-bisphosphate aldolase/phosphatase